LTEGRTTGLVVTVGFSEDPILYSIKTLRPIYVHFICSADSVDFVTKILDRIARDRIVDPNNCRRRLVEKSRPSDSLLAVHEAVKSLESLGVPREEMVVDSTGGTKPMTSGAVIAATHLGLRNIYVNVETDADRKPIPATMRIETLPNPYDDIGFLEAGLGMEHLNNHDYVVAAYVFERLRDKVIRLRLKTLYNALALLSHSLDAWEKFRHDEALETMTKARKTLQSYYDDTRDKSTLKTMRVLDEKTATLELLINQQEGTLLRILDLLANAGRRLKQGRYDDSAARSYRTVEAVEQYVLAKQGIDTSSPDYSKLTRETLDRFLEKTGLDALPKEISCYHGYMLLFSMNDPLGRDFADNERKYLGIMKARNLSILAHGFKPIAQSSAQGIYEMAEHFVKQLFSKEGLDYDRTLEEVEHLQLDQGLIPTL
jgi:CRISPR-associated protein (TIGR02710 family)